MIDFFSLLTLSADLGMAGYIFREFVVGLFLPLCPAVLCLWWIRSFGGSKGTYIVRVCMERFFFTALEYWARQGMLFVSPSPTT